MADWHGYFAAQQLNITSIQWGRLQDVLATWGPLNDPQPARMLHNRPSLAGDIILYEALFDTDDVSISGFRQALAEEFGVSPGEIGVTTGSTTYITLPSPFWTFDYAGQNRFRAGVLGGLASTWEQSRVEALGMMSANIADWQTQE